MRLQHWRLARIASCSLLCGFGTFASPRSVERLDSHRSTSAFMQSGGNPRKIRNWRICKSCLYGRSEWTDCVSRSSSKDELDAHQENLDKMRYDLRRAKAGAREAWKKLGGVQQETPAYSTNIVMGTKFPVGRDRGTSGCAAGHSGPDQKRAREMKGVMRAKTVGRYKTFGNIILGGGKKVQRLG